MISDAEIDDILDGVEERHAPRWEVLAAEFAVLRERAGAEDAWDVDALLALFRRAESLIHARADDSVAEVRMRLTPKLVNRHLRRAGEKKLGRLRWRLHQQLVDELFNGRTLEDVRAVAAKANAKAASVNNNFANLIAEALEAA